MLKSKSLPILGVLAIAAATALAMTPASAVPVDPNIISLVDDTNSCGGAVLCSTNGTLGYNGTKPFDLSTIQQWFQVDGTSPLPGQTCPSA